MITHVEGNIYAETEIGPYRKPSLTVTLKTSLGWETLPTTTTLTESGNIYGTYTFQTSRKIFWGKSSRHNTRGPRS